MDGNFYTSEETVQSYLDVLKEFKREHPLFIGSKLIYAKQKSDSNEVITSHFQTIRELHAKFPQTFVGFDLVGQEDKAPSLQTLAENIFQLPNDVQLFLHAGETNWFGSVDENLVIDRWFRVINCLLVFFSVNISFNFVCVLFFVCILLSLLMLLLLMSSRSMRFCLAVVALAMVMHL